MKLTNIIIGIFYLTISCNAQKPLLSYDDRFEVKGDKDLTEIFQKQYKDNLNKGEYTLFINPYLEGSIKLNNEDEIIFKTENSEEEDILGRIWDQRNYKKNSVKINYKGIEYLVKFNKDYRFIVVSYDRELETLIVEYSKLPWVSYGE